MDLHMPPGSHTQAHDIAVHLLDIGDISSLEATALYRISSLTKVISVLKDKYGWNIAAEWRHDRTGKRYRRYSIQKCECPIHQS